MFKDCTFTQKNGCYYCGKHRNHNRTICPERFKNFPQWRNENVVVSSSPTSTGDSKSSKAHKEEDSNGQVDSLNSTSVQTLVSTAEKVLLQTATVPIQSSNRSKTISVKAL